MGTIAPKFGYVPKILFPGTSNFQRENKIIYSSDDKNFRGARNTTPAQE